MGSSTGQEQQRAGAVAATGKLSRNASFLLAGEPMLLFNLQIS
jgi:hypothetical protein